MLVREDTQSSPTDRSPRIRPGWAQTHRYPPISSGMRLLLLSHRNLEARSDVMDLSKRNHRAWPYSPRKLLGAVLGPETSPSQHYSIISKPKLAQKKHKLQY